MMSDGEIIGKYATIDAFGREFYGTIVDETMHLIRLRVGGRTISLPKRVSCIDVDGCKIRGADIDVRPWDRIARRRS